MLKGIFAGIAVIIFTIATLSQVNHGVRSLASVFGINGADVHSVAERVNISDTSVDTSVDCDGVEAWHLAMVDRNMSNATEMEYMLAGLAEGSLTREELLVSARAFDAFAAIQARSDPPPAAAHLNALFLDGLNQYSALFVTAANGGSLDWRAADEVMKQTAEADRLLREQCRLHQSTVD